MQHCLNKSKKLLAHLVCAKKCILTLPAHYLPAGGERPAPGGHVPAARLAELRPEHGRLVDLGDDEAVAHHDGDVGKQLEEQQLAPERVEPADSSVR